MLRWIAAALVAVAAAATATILLDGPSPGPDVSVQQAVWHMDGTVTHEERWCASCHYDQDRLWNANWDRDPSGWNLSVTPTFRGVSLLYAQAAQEPILWESGELRHDWSPAASWTRAIDVQDGAGGLLARVHADAKSTLPGLATTDRHTDLVLVAPDGTRHQATGPEADLKLLVVTDPMPGAWRFEARLTDAVNGSAIGRAWIEVLGGQVAHGPATFQISAEPDGRPADTVLRVRPYHDHRLDEDIEWDEFDVAPAREVFVAKPGPTPAPKAPTAAQIDAAWNGASAIAFEERDVSYVAIYRDTIGHRDDLGLGTSKPYYYPAAGTVPVGAQKLRFEFTWDPALDEPRLGLRFSPPGTPLYFEPEPMLRKPGQLVLEAPVDPAWPLVEEGIWDLAPYLKPAPGDWQVAAMQFHLQATAHRSAAAQDREALDICSRVLDDCTYGL